MLTLSALMVLLVYMKLKKEDMLPISPTQLDDLYSALDMTHKEIGDLCGVGKFAPSGWRKTGKIPKNRLMTMAVMLAENSQIFDSITPTRKRAISFIEQVLGIPLKMLISESSEINFSSKSAIQTKGNNKAGEYYVPSLKKMAEQKETDQNLMSVPLEALINEIGRRGFRLNIEPITTE